MLGRARRSIRSTSSAPPRRLMRPPHLRSRRPTVPTQSITSPAARCARSARTTRRCLSRMQRPSLRSLRAISCTPFAARFRRSATRRNSPRPRARLPLFPDSKVMIRRGIAAAGDLSRAHLRCPRPLAPIAQERHKSETTYFCTHCSSVRRRGSRLRRRASRLRHCKCILRIRVLRPQHHLVHAGRRQRAGHRAPRPAL